MHYFISYRPFHFVFSGLLLYYKKRTRNKVHSYRVFSGVRRQKCVCRWNPLDENWYYTGVQHAYVHTVVQYIFKDAYCVELIIPINVQMHVHMIMLTHAHIINIFWMPMGLYNAYTWGYIKSWNDSLLLAASYTTTVDIIMTTWDHKTPIFNVFGSCLSQNQRNFPNIKSKSPKSA